jgi:heat shock protein HslJ
MEQAFRAQLGREWELTQLGTYSVPPSVPRNPNIPLGDPQPGVRPTIRFASDQPGFGGRSFCNGYGGPYTVRADSLQITSIESSAVGCDGPDSLETRFFRGLRETRRFTLDSATLTLIGADGTRLVFVPVDTARAR